VQRPHQTAHGGPVPDTAVGHCCCWCQIL